MATYLPPDTGTGDHTTLVVSGNVIRITRTTAFSNATNITLGYPAETGSNEAVSSPPPWHDPPPPCLPAEDETPRPKRPAAPRHKRLRVGSGTPTGPARPWHQSMRAFRGRRMRGKGGTTA